MKKLFLITFSLLILGVSVNIAQNRIVERTDNKLNISSVKKESQIYKAKLTGCFDAPTSVRALNLNKTEISANCSKTNKNCSNEKIIEVETVATDSGDRNDIRYVYKVSGGRIIGEGANVKWELSDVKPGSYTITAGISQPVFSKTRWDILGRTQTKVVVIKE